MYKMIKVQEEMKSCSENDIIKNNNNNENKKGSNQSYDSKAVYQKYIENFFSNNKEEKTNKNLVKENAYNISYFKGYQEFLNENTNSKINQDNNLTALNDNKIKEINNLEKNQNNNNSTNLFSKYNYEKENIDINNIKPSSNNNDLNVYSPIVNSEKDSERPTIYDVNYIRSDKSSRIEKLKKVKKSENEAKNEIKENKMNNNECSVKIKVEQLFKRINKVEENKNYDYNKKLKLINQRIKNSKNKYKNDFYNEEETKELTYPGLKRYRYNSSHSLRPPSAHVDVYKNYVNSSNVKINSRQNKLNVIKSTLNNFCNIKSSTYAGDAHNQNLKKINKSIQKLKQLNNEGNGNKVANQLRRAFTGTAVNNKNGSSNLNNILEALDQTMKKFPRKTNVKINLSNQSSRTFPINNIEFDEINKLNATTKNKNLKNNIFFNYNQKEYKNNFKEFNEKNMKLIFETKVNHMNNTITKLLQKDSRYYLNNKNNNRTLPPNIFNKNNFGTRPRVKKKNEIFW